MSRSEAYLRNLTHLHLDRLCIATLYTDVLGALPAVTHLYLQHNRLSSLQPLACMPQLQFLAASHNQLETVRVHTHRISSPVALHGHSVSGYVACTIRGAT